MSILVADAVNPQYRVIKPFQPFPWQVKPWRDTSKILLLTGSAGGGKSRIAAEKLHAFCLKYPYATALVLRKERAVIANSTLLFIKSEVIGHDPRVNYRASDFRFEYQNGSILVFAGMKDADQKERIRSIGLRGGVDIVWMEEATQFEEGDFNELLARMRGRAANWRQIILTTNPDAPSHWIYRRLIIGEEASVYYSHAADNPENPEDYYHSLGMLTGVDYKRLALGKWEAGSGRVIDTWNDEYNVYTGDDFGGNVTQRAEYIPDGGQVMWAIDDGYGGEKDKHGLFTGHSHPRAILLCQLRNDGTIAAFAESFEVQKLARDHIADVIEMSDKNGWPIPKYVVRDRAAASLGGDLKEYNIISRYNPMTVEESVKVLRLWVAPDANGVRRFICHPRCRYLRHEMASYSMTEEGNIIKQHDNGPDAARYIVWDQAYGVNPNVDVVSYYDVL